MKVTYEKWLKSPFGTQGLPPELFINSNIFSV